MKAGVPWRLAANEGLGPQEASCEGVGYDPLEVGGGGEGWDPLERGSQALTGAPTLELGLWVGIVLMR